MLKLFNETSHVTQTAGALRVPQIAGALTGLDTDVDVVQNSPLTLWRSPAYISYSVLKAVTDQRLIGVRFLLVHALPDLVHRQGLAAI